MFNTSPQEYDMEDSIFISLDAWQAKNVFKKKRTPKAEQEHGDTMGGT